MNFTSYLTSKGVVPPAGNEVEVSLFGAGVGECAVIHVGNGSWIIVDSCLEPETKNPISLEYLKFLGVEVETQVKMIVITHWHDDHVKGIGAVVRQCTAADIVISNTLTSAEFLQLREIQKNHKRALLELSTGVDEISEVLSITAEEYDRQRKRFIWASSRKLLRHYTNPDCKVHSLSPADAEHTKFMEFLQKSADEKLPAPKRTVVSNRKNNLAVVLWLEFQNMNILMGSDLEETGDKNVGWSAIIDSWTFGAKTARLYKVAHHGSVTGHHDGVWSGLLEKNPDSMLTPFSRSGLPRESDVKRLKSLTPNGYITSGTSSKRPPRRDSAVEKTLKEVAISHRLLGNNMGMLQWRFDLNTNHKNLKSYGSAQKL